MLTTLKGDLACFGVGPLTKLILGKVSDEDNARAIAESVISSSSWSTIRGKLLNQAGNNRISNLAKSNSLLTDEVNITDPLELDAVPNGTRPINGNTTLRMHEPPNNRAIHIMTDIIFQIMIITENTTF